MMTATDNVLTWHTIRLPKLCRKLVFLVQLIGNRATLWIIEMCAEFVTEVFVQATVFPHGHYMYNMRQFTVNLISPQL